MQPAKIVISVLTIALSGCAGTATVPFEVSDPKSKRVDTYMVPAKTAKQIARYQMAASVCGGEPSTHYKVGSTTIKGETVEFFAPVDSTVGRANSKSHCLDRALETTGKVLAKEGMRTLRSTVGATLFGWLLGGGYKSGGGSGESYKVTAQDGSNVQIKATNSTASVDNSVDNSVEMAPPEEEEVVEGEAVVEDVVDDGGDVVVDETL